jgi:hypothetical protein
MCGCTSACTHTHAHTHTHTILWGLIWPCNIRTFWKVHILNGLLKFFYIATHIFLGGHNFNFPDFTLCLTHSVCGVSLYILMQRQYPYYLMWLVSTDFYFVFCEMTLPLLFCVYDEVICMKLWLHLFCNLINFMSEDLFIFCNWKYKYLCILNVQPIIHMWPKNWPQTWTLLYSTFHFSWRKTYLCSTHYRDE